MTNDETRTALISGANRGIGLAIATGLAQRGVAVRLGCRSRADGEAAAAPMRNAGLDVTAVQLDVTDDASVAALVAAMEHDGQSLDILVNNAGIGLDYHPGLSVVERLERTLAVNVTGAARLTQAMVPFLKRSDAPRIVNVSSELASFTLRERPDWYFADMMMPTYAASKAALNALTLSYARALAADGIKVNAICPGYTATEATNFGGDRTPEQAALVAIRMAMLGADGPTGSFTNESGRVPW